jgi:hypothetical protein
VEAIVSQKAMGFIQKMTITKKVAGEEVKRVKHSAMRRRVG